MPILTAPLNESQDDYTSYAFADKNTNVGDYEGLISAMLREITKYDYQHCRILRNSLDKIRDVIKSCRHTNCKCCTKKIDILTNIFNKERKVLEMRFENRKLQDDNNFYVDY